MKHTLKTIFNNTPCTAQRTITSPMPGCVVLTFADGKRLTITATGGAASDAMEAMWRELWCRARSVCEVTG